MVIPVSEDRIRHCRAWPRLPASGGGGACTEEVQDNSRVASHTRGIIITTRLPSYKHSYHNTPLQYHNTFGDRVNNNYYNRLTNYEYVSLKLFQQYSWKWKLPKLRYHSPQNLKIDVQVCTVLYSNSLTIVLNCTYNISSLFTKKINEIFSCV